MAAVRGQHVDMHLHPAAAYLDTAIKAQASPAIRVHFLAIVTCQSYGWNQAIQPEGGFAREEATVKAL